jgi:chemotaxis protein CheC
MIPESVLEPLAEIIGIGMGRAAEVLNTMLDAHVTLTAPVIRVLEPGELEGALGADPEAPLAAVEMDYGGELVGSAQLIFASDDAGRLVDCITAGASLPGEDLDTIRVGTLCEVGNIVINAIMGTVANVTHVDLDYSVPIYLRGRPAELFRALGASPGGLAILVSTRFSVELIEVDGDIVLFLRMDSVERLGRAVARFVHG